MISPDTIIQVYNILKSFKEAYDEYASNVEECEITLRMVSQLMEDRSRIATINAANGNVAQELRSVFDLLSRSVLEFDVSVNGVDDEKDELLNASPNGQTASSNNSNKIGKKVFAVSKSFARKALTAALAKGKSEEISNYTERLKNILKMVEIETSTAQARSLAVMSGQGASDLMTNTVPAAKKFWTDNFLNRMEISTDTFFHALQVEFGGALSQHLGDQLEKFMHGLSALLDRNGDGSVDVREYAKLVDLSQFEKDQVPSTLLDILVSQISTFSGPSRQRLSSMLLGGHTQAVKRIVKLSKDFFATFDASGDVKVWSQASLGSGIELLTSLRVPSNAVTAVAFLDTPWPNTAVLGGDDGSITLYDILGARRLGCLTPHDAAIGAMKGAPNRSLLFACSVKSNEILVHDPTSKSMIGVMSGHIGAVCAMEMVTLRCDQVSTAPTSAVPVLATAAVDGEVRLWDLDSHSCVYRFAVGTHDRVMKLLVRTSPTGSGDTLYVWHRRTDGSKQANLITGFNFINTSIDGRYAYAAVDPAVFSITPQSVVFRRQRAERIEISDENQRLSDFDVSSSNLLFLVERAGKPNRKLLDAVLVWVNNRMFKDICEAAKGEQTAAPEQEAIKVSPRPNIEADDASKGDDDGEDSGEEEDDKDEEDGDEEDSDRDANTTEAFTLTWRSESVLLEVDLTKACISLNRVSSESSITSIAMIDTFVVWADEDGTISRHTAISSQTCRNNHELVLMVSLNPIGGHYCDLCRKSITNGGAMRCNDCDFDSCLECWQVGRSADERNAIATKCYASLGVCSRCKVQTATLSKVKMEEEEVCFHCQGAAGDVAYWCGECGSSICHTCRVDALRPHDVALLAKQPAASQRPLPSGKAATGESADAEGTSEQSNYRAKLAVFGGCGLWTGHRLMVDSTESTTRNRKLQMCLSLAPQGFETAHRGRYVHRWGADGRLLSVQDVLVQDNEIVLGGWRFATQAAPVKLEGRYPVQPLRSDSASETKAPAITVLYCPPRHDQKKQITAVATDAGHVGLYDGRGVLLSSYQLLREESNSVCTVCFEEKLHSVESRLAEMCEKCLKRVPGRGLAISVEPHQGLWAWVPPQGVLSCIPGLASWSRVFVKICIPDKNRCVAGLLISADASGDSPILKVPLTRSTKVSETSMRFLVGEKSPQVCVCGLAITTVRDDSAIDALSCFKGSESCVVILAFEHRSDQESIVASLNSGKPLQEMSECIRCLRRRKGNLEYVVAKVPSKHFYCTSCADALFATKRVSVISIACNDHSVFVGVENASGDSSCYIEQFPFDLSKGPLTDGTIRTWSGTPNSFICVADRLLYSTGSLNPPILVAGAAAAGVAARGNVLCDIGGEGLLSDEESDMGDMETEVTKGVTTIAALPVGDLVVAVTGDQVIVYREGSKKGDGDDVSYEVALHLAWSHGGAYDNVTAIQSTLTGPLVTVLAGFAAGGILAWRFDPKTAAGEYAAPIAELLGHTDAVTVIQVLNGTVVSSGADNTIHYWKLSSFQGNLRAELADSDPATAVDPTQWEWVWYLTRVTKSTFAPTRRKMTDDDGRRLTQFYNKCRDLDFFGRFEPFRSSTLDMEVAVTVERATREWFMESVGGEAGRYGISCSFVCLTGTRSFLKLDPTNGEEGSVESDKNVLLNSGEAATLLLTNADGCGCLDDASTGCSLTLDLRLLGVRCASRNDKVTLGIGLLHLHKRDTDDTSAAEEEQAAVMKRIVKYARDKSNKNAADVVYVDITSDQDTLRVDLPSPWYVPLYCWGELVVVNVTSKRSKLWINVDSIPPVISVNVLRNVPPSGSPAACTVLEDIDDDDKDGFRQGQFLRFECPLCNALPQGGLPHSTDGNVALACNRRCPDHPNAYCLEPHATSSCPLCYSNYHQLNRRNCYACGRAVCSSCCFVRVPLSAACSQNASKEGTLYPICIMCDLDSESAKQRHLLE